MGTSAMALPSGSAKLWSSLPILELRALQLMCGYALLRCVSILKTDECMHIATLTAKKFDLTHLHPKCLIICFL